jgi:two-component system, NtrC family, sensor kinase
VSHSTRLRGGIGRRIAVSFSLLLAIFALASTLAFAALHELHEALHAVERDAARMRSASKLASAVRDQYAHMAHTIIIGDDSHHAMYNEAAAAVQKTAEEVRSRSSDVQSNALVARIQKASTELDQVYRDKLIPAVRGAQTRLPADLHPWILDTVSHAQAAADELAAAGEKSIAAFGAHAQLVQHAAVGWLLGFLLVALLCAGGVAFYLHRSIARPIAALADGAARIGSGDLDVRLEVRDGDELGRLAEQFNVMAAALKEHQTKLVQQEKVAFVGRLAAGVAHEINNPLGVILGYVKLMRRNGAEPAKELAIIEEEADRCREIVENLLDLTRQSPVAREAVDLRMLCEKTVERLRVSSGRQEPVVHIRGQGAVMGSPKGISQAVHNLVKNALEAVQTGGHIDINIASDKTGVVAITVADDGPGIAPDQRHLVFEPFFTTKPSGTGLGLALSKAIARAHGGDIELLSQGAHATFRLTLPAEQRRPA